MPYSNGSEHQWRKRLALLETERSKYEAVWKEIEQYEAPKTLRLDQSEYNEGQKQHQLINDETILRARRTLVAGFVSGMTSPARPWFKLTTPDPALSEFRSVRVWLDDVESRIYQVLSRSNFYQAIARMYDDLATYGTAAMSALEDDEFAVWFYPHPMGTYFLSQNSRGMVDTNYRKTTRTVRQLVETFGLENCSDSVKTQYNNGSLDARVKVYNAIEPNDDRVPERRDFQNMPFRSVWWECGQGSANNQYLGKRGFMDFPTMAARWYATPLDDYGVDCPGMTALGGCKQLHFEQKRKAQAIDKMVNPPVQAPSALKRGNQVKMLPGGITYYDEATPNGGVRPLFDRDPYIEPLLGSMQEVRQRINESFYVDMFLMISQEDEVRTATEMALRNEEKLLVLGPTLNRVQTEILDPVIDRVFNILARNEMLPPPPPELEGVDLSAKYISMLAQAQQSVGASSIERLVNTAMTMEAGGFQGALDKVDSDAVLDAYGDILGVDAKLIRGQDQVTEIRGQRQQQAQAMQAMEMAQGAASAARDASQVDLSTDNPIARLTGSAIGQ